MLSTLDENLIKMLYLEGGPKQAPRERFPWIMTKLICLRVILALHTHMASGIADSLVSRGLLDVLAILSAILIWLL